MIPSKTFLPTITPPGKYGQLVELITAAAELDDEAAARLADSLLDRLGLYGPTPEPVYDRCSAMFFSAELESEGWVQCDKDPGHVRQGDPLHEDQRSDAYWTDAHRQAVAADNDDE